MSIESRIPTRLARGTRGAPDLLRERRGRRRPRAHEARRPVDRPAKRVRMMRADPERRMRALERLRLERGVLELPELAGEGHARLGPEGPHQPEPLVEARHPARRRDAEGGVDLRVPAEADPDVETAAGELIDGRQALGQMHRAPERREQDRRPEPDPARSPRPPTRGAPPARGSGARPAPAPRPRRSRSRAPPPARGSAGSAAGRCRRSSRPEECPPPRRTRDVTRTLLPLGSSRRSGQGHRSPLDGARGRARAPAPS